MTTFCFKLVTKQTYSILLQDTSIHNFQLVQKVQTSCYLTGQPGRGGGAFIQWIFKCASDTYTLLYSSLSCNGTRLYSAFHCKALHVFFYVKYCLPVCIVFCGGFPACFLGSLASDTPETAFILQVNGYLFDRATRNCQGDHVSGFFYLRVIRKWT